MKKGNKKRTFKESDLVGDHGISFVRKSESRRAPTGKAVRYFIFKCHCGKEFESRLDSVAWNRTKSCGCNSVELRMSNVRKHGLYLHPIYDTWVSIKERIFNQKNPGYKNYGERGIQLFSIWQVDFQSFYDYVSALPHFGEKGYSIDRINTNGHYEPGNIRWTTRHIQNTNVRPKVSKESGYTGVHKSSKNAKTWHFKIMVNGIRHVFRNFRSAEEATLAREKFIKDNNLVEYKYISVNSRL